MTGDRFSFGDFTLDCGDRQLRRAGQVVEINSRYLDALGLLVRENGRLVSKDRFLSEVWRGVPVTDEALTQCIRLLRKSLGDDVSRPQFIETVPKHGYRFIAPVQEAGQEPGEARTRPTNWRKIVSVGGAATVGGGMAGFAGGLIYGFAAASAPDGGTGALSSLLVIQCLTILVAVTGGAGVGFGMAFAGLQDWRRAAIGGAVGGLIVGAAVKMLGVDAFHLLFGQAPAGITGGLEGALLGCATGIGAAFASRPSVSARRGAVVSGLCGAVAGFIAVLLHGRLMGGSLDLLAHTFPNSRLRLDSIGNLFGEAGFGTLTQFLTAPLEGALFASCVTLAIRIARKGAAALD